MRNCFLQYLRGGGEINANFQKILGHSVSHRGLGIPDPRLSVEIAYNISKVTSGKLGDSLLGGTNLKYVFHRACVRRASARAIKEKKFVEMEELDIQK